MQQCCSVQVGLLYLQFSIAVLQPILSVLSLPIHLLGSPWYKPCAWMQVFWCLQSVRQLQPLVEKLGQCQKRGQPRKWRGRLWKSYTIVNNEGSLKTRGKAAQSGNGTLKVLTKISLTWLGGPHLDKKCLTHKGNTPTRSACVPMSISAGVPIKMRPSYTGCVGGGVGVKLGLGFTCPLDMCCIAAWGVKL